MGAALEALEGRALIFNNELVDAFPCKLFEKTPEGWRELGVRLSAEGGLSECFFGEKLDNPWFGKLGQLPTGQRVERHDSYSEWQNSWAASWREGSLLTIDYGDLAQDLYTHSPAGSLRGYWKHRRLTGRDVYSRFGKQDLTADVNFSDLMDWGLQAGWRTLQFTTQREFLQTWCRKSSESAEKEGILDSPQGAGGAFKVLEQVPEC
jgi:SAM-dependent MidA family methyltransferase